MADVDEVRDLEAEDKVRETCGSRMIIILLLTPPYLFLEHMS